jgi:hypothetical protein
MCHRNMLARLREVNKRERQIDPIVNLDELVAGWCPDA